MKKRKRIVLRTLAFAKKEFKLRTRYPWHYISSVVIMPLLHVIPLIILYGGLMGVASGSLDEISPDNYLAWIFLGSLIYSTFTIAFGTFNSRFVAEKYWMTIHGTLIAPVSKYYLLFGVIIDLIISGSITTLIFLVISFLSFPTGLINILFIFLVFLMTLVSAAGIGLIKGSLHLINENLSPLFDYGLYFLIFFSCYSIPFELYPPIFHIVIFINPVYHFINLTRGSWLGWEVSQVDPLFSFLYLLVFTIMSVVLGVYFFNKLTRRYGVRGY